MTQPISWDASARAVAHLQPLKMAAFEGFFMGGPHAPLAIGGIPDVKDRKVLYAIELPSMMSISFRSYGGGPERAQIRWERECFRLRAW
jgi:cytochrome bd-type quinol oxidase subunit 1